jgi:hypothetical protein
VGGVSDNVRQIVIDMNGANLMAEAIHRLLKEIKDRGLGPLEWAQAHAAQHVMAANLYHTVDIVFDRDPKALPKMVNNRPTTLAGIPFHRNNLMPQDEIEFFGGGLLVAKIIHLGVPEL